MSQIDIWNITTENRTTENSWFFSIFNNRFLQIYFFRWFSYISVILYHIILFVHHIIFSLLSLQTPLSKNFYLAIRTCLSLAIFISFYNRSESFILIVLQNYFQSWFWNRRPWILWRWTMSFSFFYDILKWLLNSILIESWPGVWWPRRCLDSFLCDEFLGEEGVDALHDIVCQHLRLKIITICLLYHL